VGSFAIKVRKKVESLVSGRTRPHGAEPHFGVLGEERCSGRREREHSDRECAVLELLPVNPF